MKKLAKFGLTACILLATWGAVNLDAQTTIRQSYYVDAMFGNDGNNGRSEERAFKTMEKAVEAAKMGIVKTITIIGSLGGLSINGIGTDEILITGKADAGVVEKAVIYSGVKLGSGVTIKFTYITIEGNGVDVSDKVTLGQNVVIQNCGTGVYGSGNGSTTVVLTDNAVITGCRGAGIERVRTVIMTDDSSVTHNRIGVSASGSSVTLTMSGNAKISNNREHGINGGTLTMSGNTEISNNSGGGVNGNTLTMSGNAKISNNQGRGVNGGALTMSGNTEISNNSGGGVNVGKLVMSGGRIIDNTVEGYGGGVNCSEAEITGGEIAGNQAERGGGIYFISPNTRNSSTISGCTISGNKAEYGAGVFLSVGNSFTLSGGSITGNEAEFVGGGVYVDGGATYTATGGSVTDNTAGDGVGNDIFTK